MQSYGTDRRIRGLGTGADPFWDLQYLKRSEHRAGIGVERDEPGKLGYRGLPRYQTDGGDLLAVFGRVQGRRDDGTETTPGRRRDVISGLPRLFSQGDMPVWRERHHVPVGDGGAALVYCGMLHGSARRDNHQRRGGGDGG